jgi:hypothetical protein
VKALLFATGVALLSLTRKTGNASWDGGMIVSLARDR